ncbi:MAG: hypothetical protein KDD69_19075 [Bdellovibrionales bacterium]|nr:hypothetical protein [Bdellovibrionales bacterium]
MNREGYRVLKYLFLLLVAASSVPSAYAQSCVACNRHGCITVSSDSPLATACTDAAPSGSTSTPGVNAAADNGDESDPSPTDSDDSSYDCTLGLFYKDAGGVDDIQSQLAYRATEAAITNVDRTHQIRKLRPGESPRPNTALFLRFRPDSNGNILPERLTPHGITALPFVRVKKWVNGVSTDVLARAGYYSGPIPEEHHRTYQQLVESALRTACPPDSR